MPPNSGQREGAFCCILTFSRRLGTIVRLSGIVHGGFSVWDGGGRVVFNVFLADNEDNDCAGVVVWW